MISSNAPGSVRGSGTMAEQGTSDQSVEELTKLTDEKLKEALEKFGLKIEPITPSTRPAAEQQLRAQLAGRLDVPDNAAPSALMLSEKTFKIFSEENCIANSEAEVFYGITLPEEDAVAGGENIQRVFTDKAECLAALKKHRGSRFKAFRTYKEALGFAEAGATPAASHGATAEESAASSLCVSAEKPSPFRGPKSQDLVKFRKSIEKNDMDYFTKCIEENPRYLVSSGDTPAVLQEGFRYNALHVACRTSKPSFVAKVLSTVSQAEFFQRLYPDDTRESSARRSAFLLDLYLNTPDKGCNETPVHFASKHGSLECVRVLVSYPGCDATRPNKYGQKPVEIAGSRMKEKSSSVVEEICNLLGEQYYVPLFRDDDLCLLPQVGRPWSPKLDSPTSPIIAPDWLYTSSPSSSSPASPISPSLKVRGYAGPMTSTQADTFHRLWRSNSTLSSPSRLSKSHTVSLRLIDQEKGLERVGRDLAAEKNVNWKEFWDFLGKFTSMSTEEGLSSLEAYLRDKTSQLKLKQEELDASDLASRLTEAQRATKKCSPNTEDEVDGREEVNVSGVSQASWSTLGELCQELEALRLNASLSPQGDGPTQDLVSASSKFLESWKPTSPSGIASGRGRWQGAEEEAAAQQLSYILKSVEVAANRLSEVLRELAHDLQSSTVASLSLHKTLRAKLRPEILCLRNVVAKTCSQPCQDGVDFGFIHVLLTSRAVEHLRQSVTPSDVSVLAETMKMFVSHLSYMQLDSSDEEGGSRVSAFQENRQNDMEHFSCVLKCLEKALNIVQFHCCPDMDISKENTKLEMLQLGECCCCWEVKDTQATRKQPDATPISATKYSKAFTFLHQTLFKEHTVQDPVVKQLSFTSVDGEEEEEEEEKQVLVRARLGAKEGFTVSQNLVKTANDHKGAGTKDIASSLPPQDKEEEDNESFVSAASSIEDAMLTPEEGLKVFINGLEASKLDSDVLAAVGEKQVDEKRFPHVFQWQHLVSSFSEAQRGSWASPFCRRGRGQSLKQCLAPSSMSQPSTPHRPPHARPPASTPRVLFSKPWDASPS